MVTCGCRLSALDGPGTAQGPERSCSLPGLLELTRKVRQGLDLAKTEKSAPGRVFNLVMSGLH